MNGQGFSHPDAARSRLRDLVALIEIEMARLPEPIQTADGDTPPSGLHAAWARLLDQLALGPEPEVRECPVCHHIGMRAANVCGYCWTALEPLAKRVDGAALA